MTMNLTLNNVNRNNSNDSLEYYYFLSTSALYSTVRNWVKIEKVQVSDNKLEFTINTNDISNFGDIKANGNLYLYIKEVAKKGNSTSEFVAKAIPVESAQAIEVYIDGVKQVSNNNNNDNNNNNNSGTSSRSGNDRTNNTNQVDDTKATRSLPRTGAGTLIITVFFITIAGIGMYFKYNSMKFQITLKAVDNIKLSIVHFYYII